jgi:hypothetical protein
MRIEGRTVGGASAALLALLLAFPLSAAAADRVAQAASQGDSKTSQPAAGKGPSAKDAKTQKKDTTRRKTFRPSERISADTAVAFPVDI